jgi:hypothetical protein
LQEFPLTEQGSSCYECHTGQRQLDF